MAGNIGNLEAVMWYATTLIYLTRLELVYLVEHDYIAAYR